MDILKKLYWIDAVKAICMISVYVVHTEVYFGKVEISYGYWLTPFYVNAFFFVSGYLLFRKYLMNLSNASSKEPYSYAQFKQHLYKIFAALIWPTILFSSIIYIPKIIFHSKELSVIQYSYNVFGGVSFWFTSAIVISQVILAILLLFQLRNIYVYIFVSLMLFIMALLLKDIDTTPFPWYYKSGMGATLFMTFGGLYMAHEQKIDKVIGKFCFYGIVLVYIVIMWLDISALNAHSVILSMNFNFLGMTESILGIIIIIGVAKFFSENRYLTYIGKNSIFYYFFSGVLPASLGLVIQNIFGIQLGYWGNLLIIILSLVICTVLSNIINRYFSYLLDFRKLPFLNNERKA